MKLLIATPMYGSQCSGLFADSMCRLYRECGKWGVKIEHTFHYGGSLIPVIRTTMANDFLLRTDSTHLLFVDADIGFKPEYVLELLRVQQRTKCAIVGGTYPHKRIDWESVVGALKQGMVSTAEELNFFTGNYTVELLDKSAGFDPDSKDPVEVLHMGAGFVLIPRETFNLFRNRFPEYALSGGIVAYFQAAILSGQYVSEDAFFCMKVREAGGCVLMCPWMRLAHVGGHVYGWNPTKPA